MLKLPKVNTRLLNIDLSHRNTMALNFGTICLTRLNRQPCSYVAFKKMLLYIDIQLEF